jgi:hypothetical protein
VFDVDFEGHHVSSHFTTVADHACSLCAQIRFKQEGLWKGNERFSLVNEEDMGLQLFNMLSSDQQKIAILMKKTYNDVVSFNKAVAEKPFLCRHIAEQSNGPPKKNLYDTLRI